MSSSIENIVSNRGANEAAVKAASREMSLSPNAIVCEESKQVGQSINIKATELYRSRVGSKDFICGPAAVVLGVQF